MNLQGRSAFGSPRMYKIINSCAISINMTDVATYSPQLAVMWADNNALHRIHGLNTSHYARSSGQATPIVVEDVQEYFVSIKFQEICWTLNLPIIVCLGCVKIKKLLCNYERSQWYSFEMWFVRSSQGTILKPMFTVRPIRVTKKLQQDQKRSIERMKNSSDARQNILRWKH